VTERLPRATLAAALACGVLACLPSGMGAGLAYDRQAILAGEIWRLWTGHLVHFTTQQAILDASILLLAGVLTEVDLGWRRFARLLLIGMPAISLGLLLLVPGLAEYRGASGVAMMLSVTAVAILWSIRQETRTALLLLGICFALKTLLDALGLATDFSGLPEDISVAWQAHVLGAGIGGAAVLAAKKYGRDPDIQKSSLAGGGGLATWLSGKPH